MCVEKIRPVVEIYFDFCQCIGSAAARSGYIKLYEKVPRARPRGQSLLKGTSREKQRTAACPRLRSPWMSAARSGLGSVSSVSCANFSLKAQRRYPAHSGQPPMAIVDQRRKQRLVVYSWNAV